MHIGYEHAQSEKANQSQLTLPTRAVNFVDQGSLWKMISPSCPRFLGWLARHKSPTISIDRRMTQMWELPQQSAISNQQSFNLSSRNLSHYSSMIRLGLELRQYVASWMNEARGCLLQKTRT
jgi:hypothetical protein